MHDSYSSEQNDSSRQTSTAAQTRGFEDTWAQPSSSRMLTNYLADVEQNLDEHRWELALRDVVDLPKIAVALADPELRSSHERCRAWCEQWVRPPSTATDTEAALDHEHICRLIEEKSGGTGKDPSVPSLELRRLRLRRHARNAPRGFNASHTVKSESGDIFAVCTAVVEGVRRWYAHFACHDATSQANLARLAVLR
jgi:hypothetical protein